MRSRVSPVATLFMLLIPIIMLGVPAVMVVLGIVLMVAGFVQHPQHAQDAARFASDRSCAPKIGLRRAGACTSVDAIAESVAPASSRTSRSGTTGPRALIRFSDGTSTLVELGGDSRAFVENVASGTPVRVQSFDGRIVRIAGGGYETETALAPDVQVASDNLLPLVGLGSIAAGLLAAFLAVRTTRGR